MDERRVEHEPCLKQAPPAFRAVAARQQHIRETVLGQYAGHVAGRVLKPAPLPELGGRGSYQRKLGVLSGTRCPARQESLRAALPEHQDALDPSRGVQ